MTTLMTSDAASSAPARHSRLLSSVPAVALAIALASVGIHDEAHAGALDFDIVNRTNQAIVALWASPANSTSWGQAFDNTYVPENGGRQSVVFKGPASACNYSIRVQFAEGAVRYWDSINLCTTRGLQIFVSNGEVRATTW